MKIYNNYKLNKMGELFSDIKTAKLSLVGNPKRHKIYLWIGSDDGCFGIINNYQTLKKLAKQIQNKCK